MGDFKINGHVVPEAEWLHFKEIFNYSPFSSYSDSKPVQGYFADNEFTRDEFIEIFDYNGDKKLSYKDFVHKRALYESLSLSESFKKYGLDVDAELGRQYLASDVKDMELFAPWLWDSEGFVLAAMKQDEFAISGLEYVYMRRKYDFDSIVEMAAYSVAMLDTIANGKDDDMCFYEREFQDKAKTLVTNAWEKIISTHQDKFKNLSLPDTALASYEEFKKYVSDNYDIGHLQRFRTFNTLFDILETRNNIIDPEDPRPLAVVIYPKTDWNGAFEARQFAAYPVIDRLKSLGYRVVFFEAGEDNLVDQYLDKATDGGKRKADLIVLGGHGTATTLELDDGFWPIWLDDSKYIDTGDFEGDDPDIHLARYISPDGDVILDSCSNGEGMEENPDNQANTVARTLPKGVTIHAFNQIASLSGINFNSNGKLMVEARGTHRSPDLPEDASYTCNGTL